MALLSGAFGVLALLLATVGVYGVVAYGVERLTWFRMSPEMGPPETLAWEYPMADDSWAAECAAFLEDIREGRQPQPGIADAQAALRIIEQIYGRPRA